MSTPITETTFVVVGGGLAGAKAVETLRTEGFGGRLVLVTEEAERPYERPPLSKGYLLGNDERERAFVHGPGWYAENRVELRFSTSATGLRPAEHELELASPGGGAERLRYDKLLLTTGSRVRRLSIPRADLDGVRYLRTLPDSDVLRTTLVPGARVVVIGAGWIGLEVTAAARHHGAEVMLVELDAVPLRQVLGDELGAFFANLHAEHGVQLRFGAQAQEIRGTGGRVSGVALADGTELPADAVVIGIGIRPATELAEAAGLAIENGVAVDASLRTSDPDIYAAGDVASMVSPLIGRRIRVEHWANALDGGPAAARSMLGQQVVYDRVPYFFSDQYDLGMEYAGWAPAGSYQEVVYRGDVTKREFIAFWVSEGRVLAGMNVNVWDVTDSIQALVRAGYSGTSVDLARLADPQVPLDDLLG
jgi:3-phenylpropionate/trans-cinnamate dioxygenase ferredoxin reductase component